MIKFQRLSPKRRTAAVVLFALAVMLTASAVQASQLVTLRASGTTVSEILQILADRSELNIVTSPDVEQRVISIQMKDTPFEEALNIVVRAAGLAYERVGDTILVADIKTLSTQTGLVTRVFDLKHADANYVAEALTFISEDISIDPVNSRVIFRGPHAAVEQAAAVIAHMDRKPQQILLEARLIEVNTTELEEIGIDWEKLAKWSTNIVEGYHGAGTPGEYPEEIDYTRMAEGAGFYRQYATFNLAIEALISDGHAKLLSNAKVVTINGETAEIFAGETVPVVITSLQSGGGGAGVMQSVQLEKIDVGVRLNITPRVSGDGFITTLVEPEVSRILRFVGPDEDLPQTSTRRALSNVRVRDGQTIYLGGLISEEIRHDVKKLPLLGDIPLLGRLFSYTRNEKVRLDLVIEITPRLVGDSDDTLPSTAVEAPELTSRLENKEEDTVTIESSEIPRDRTLRH
jgi:type II secretory pathway component GspD/PulD (secretin)